MVVCVVFAEIGPPKPKKKKKSSTCTFSVRRSVSAYVIQAFIGFQALYFSVRIRFDFGILATKTRSSSTRQQNDVDGPIITIMAKR